MTAGELAGLEAPPRSWPLGECLWQEEQGDAHGMLALGQAPGRGEGGSPPDLGLTASSLLCDLSASCCLSSPWPPPSCPQPALCLHPPPHLLRDSAGLGWPPTLVPSMPAFGLCPGPACPARGPQRARAPCAPVSAPAERMGGPSSWVLPLGRQNPSCKAVFSSFPRDRLESEQFTGGRGEK